MNRKTISYCTVFFLAFLLSGNVFAELKNYSVAIGHPSEFFLEPEQGEGRWPHYVIVVQNGNAKYSCVLNLFSRKDVPMKHKIIDIPKDDKGFNHLFKLPAGIHALPYHHDPQAPISGGLDYFRHPSLKDVTTLTPWKNEQLVKDLKIVPIFDELLKNAEKVYVFGERYPARNGIGDGGIHDVHQNQGNIAGTRFAVLDGIWQDGGVIVEYDDGTRKIILTQFEVQKNQSDNEGHGIP